MFRYKLINKKSDNSINIGKGFIFLKFLIGKG